MLKKLGPLCIALCLTAPANAAVIQADSVSDISSEYSLHYLGDFTIDGSGLGGADLTSVDPTSVAHADYARGNSWTTAWKSKPLDAFIRWSFDSVQSLGGIYLWNHRSNNVAANGGYEPTLFDLTLFDNNNTALLSLDDVALGPDTATAQALGFGSIIGNVSSILFEVEAVQSSETYTGLAEVAFETSNRLNPATRVSVVSAAVPTVVPLPAAFPLLAGGLGLLGFAGWRRKRKAAAAA